jgi:hypothetical protein
MGFLSVAIQQNRFCEKLRMTENKAYWKRQQKKARDYESALKVIRTWALFDMEHRNIIKCLVPEHVVSLCDRALGKE